MPLVEAELVAAMVAGASFAYDYGNWFNMSEQVGPVGSARRAVVRTACATRLAACNRICCATTLLSSTEFAGLAFHPLLPAQGRVPQDKHHGGPCASLAEGRGGPGEGTAEQLLGGSSGVA